MIIFLCNQIGEDTTQLIIHTRDDVRVIDEVLSGKTEAFSCLVEKYKDKVFRMAFQLLQQREEAEDAAQDTFVKAYNGLVKFRKKSKFSTWLYRIVYNECISRLRKVKNRGIQFEESLLSGPLYEAGKDDEEWHEKEFREAKLKTALLQLEPVDRALVVFYYYGNRSIEEIADLVSLSSSNVKTRLFRTRKKLYTMLVKQGINEMVEN